MRRLFPLFLLVAMAGCSAGAMIFGARIPTSLFSSRWQSAFGLLSDSFIIPHYDELPGLASKGMALLQGNLAMIGVEGNTALAITPQAALVRGSGSVTIARGKFKTRYTQS